MLLRSIRLRLLALVLAVVIPFAALIGTGIWNQWQDDHAAAISRAMTEARLLAAQVDDHIGNLEHLLTGLSLAVSTNPADASANDTLLRQAKAALPNFFSHIMLFSLDGNNIGTSWEGEGARVNIADELYFRQVLNGQRFAVRDVHVGRVTRKWVVNVARAVEDRTGRLQAVLGVGTQLEHFQDALRLDYLPPGSVVRIVNQRGIVVAQSVPGPNWIGRDLATSQQVQRHLAAREASDIAIWSDNVERFTGSSAAHRVPWLVSVGIPTEVASAALASRLQWGIFLGIAALIAAFAIAWMYSGRVVRPLRQLEKDAALLAAGELNHRTAVRTRDEVGNLAGVFNHMAVSLEQRQSEMQQAKDTLAAVIEASPVAISCSDLDRRMVLWNRAAEQLYGYTAEEVVGAPIKVIPPGSGRESYVLYQRALSGEIIRDVQVKRRRKDGSLVDVRLAAAPMYDHDGKVRGVAWAVEDITDRKRAEEQLWRLAHYDPLTKLPNRLSLQKELGRLLAGEARKRPTSIAIFDLDGFKDVNDTLGHSIGDQLLVDIGQRLLEVGKGRRETYQVFRLGGDEFVASVPDCGDPRVIGEIADAILKRFAEPFQINDQTIHLGGSAGVAIAPNDGTNVDELIANADLALYQAKSDGGRTCRFFQPVLRARAQARRGLDLELRRAFAENEFEFYFQPQIRLVDHAVVGAEALLRWHHPERGILAPTVFIETLAESSIALEVGRWIMHTVCRQTSAWRAVGLPLSRIAINLFPPQLNEDALSKNIEDALKESGLPADALELEITENVALSYTNAVEPLQKLRDKGVKFAFDDFGTEYASLSYLTRFPVSRIKIDHSFIRNITDNAKDAAMVRSVIAMAHNLGLAVIAEGVETDAQAAYLLNEKCEEVQGFLYAKPLPAAEFEDYLRTRQFAVQSKSSIDQQLTSDSHAQRPGMRLSSRRRFPRAYSQNTHVDFGSDGLDRFTTS
jgi:diguanylate cyclase (GGDEF)-like protein/PAS domain S-box-containing protein